jgi:DNA-binding NarL/FixJ family response regulator
MACGELPPRSCQQLCDGELESGGVDALNAGVTIVIIEDHLMFRDVLRKACTSQFGHKVIGETASGKEGVDMILRLSPDMVILDLSLPDMDGFNVVDRVLTAKPATRILVVSSHCDDYTLFRVEKSGVHGFLDKNSNTLDTLKDALVAIEAGRIYFSAAYQQAKLARRTDPRSFIKVLSEWERAILCLIGQGLTDLEIGQRLKLSPRTVQTHRSNILRKLDIKGTPKLIAFAIENGFTQVPAKRGSNADRPQFTPEASKLAFVFREDGGEYVALLAGRSRLQVAGEAGQRLVLNHAGV